MLNVAGKRYWKHLNLTKGVAKITKIAALALSARSKPSTNVFGNLTQVLSRIRQSKQREHPGELRRIHSRHTYLQCVITNLPERPTVITSKAPIFTTSLAIVVLCTSQGSRQSNTRVRKLNGKGSWLVYDDLTDVIGKLTDIIEY